MPIYMKYGTAIKGESQADGHDGKDGWIEIESAQFGTSRQVADPTSKDKDREASPPVLTEIVITKKHDSTSTALWKESLKGKGVTVVIDYTKTGSDKLGTFISFTLTGAMISSYNFSGHGGEDGHPVETLTLDFIGIEYKTQSYLDDGTLGPIQRAAWDIAQVTDGWSK